MLKQMVKLKHTCITKMTYYFIKLTNILMLDNPYRKDRNTTRSNLEREIIDNIYDK